MKRSTQWLGTAGALALILAPTIAAAAPVGTAANSDISNSVTVTYSVGGTAQTPITSAADVFKVDRKIDLVVTSQDGAPVNAGPGGSAATTFTVTNNSNATIDFDLAAAAASGGTFTVTGIKIYRETGSNTIYAAGTNALVTAPVTGIASGNSIRIYVVADMVITPGGTPVLPVDGDTANVTLSATAFLGGSAIAQTPSGTANGKTTVETVYADAAGAATGDVAKDGKHSALGSYKIVSAKLAIAKYSRIISDPFSGSSSPRAIPGAVVEYCIVVKNTSTTTDASSVSISDTIDTAKLQTITAPTVGGTFDNVDTCTGGAAGTWNTAGPTDWKYAFGTVAKNTTSLVRFQATIQ